MTAEGWVSPLPSGVAKGVHVYRPGWDLDVMAHRICEWSWRGLGRRVYAWPDGTLAVVAVGSLADTVLLGECIDMLLVTYARHGLFTPGEIGNGPALADVLEELRCAGERA